MLLPLTQMSLMIPMMKQNISMMIIGTMMMMMTLKNKRQRWVRKCFRWCNAGFPVQVLPFAQWKEPTTMTNQITKQSRSIFILLNATVMIAALLRNLIILYSILVRESLFLIEKKTAAECFAVHSRTLQWKRELGLLASESFYSTVRVIHYHKTKFKPIQQHQC